MSKKKNTLKDLDEFLKQQAATLVTPQRLSDKVESSPQAQEAEQEPTQKYDVAETSPVKSDVTAQSILNDLKMLAESNEIGFRQQLYDIVIRAIEARNEFSPEDKMLINTALYLKSGDRWKDVIRDYWKKHQR